MVFIEIESHVLYVFMCVVYILQSYVLSFLFCFVFAALNQQRLTQSAPGKQSGQLPSSTHGGVMGGNNQLRLQQIEKERLRLQQHRPQVSRQFGLSTLISGGGA